ncbi:hypothetical protein KMZ68_04640 [Bradyrhizobium sediminis]|uniref:Uncharacterized protein n=1 Tax=Bradyrhizobium sediminis TaxID=2840469 RepID=A0A975NR38_9BRAD|nr:hypothetical protein [Bradyrhizobium sediminis]QWG19166.1 hypothetical protein KMZ68_04640 [Bradyrhizobium sediminis]
MTLAGCYKATVNEPETITEAQPFSLVRGLGGAGERQAFGCGFPAAPHIERS